MRHAAHAPTPQALDAAYVAAMRRAIRQGEGKRRPTAMEVAYLAGVEGCLWCLAGIRWRLPSLHRLHGL